MDLYDKSLVQSMNLLNAILPTLLGEGDVPRCRPLLID